MSAALDMSNIAVNVALTVFILLGLWQQTQGTVAALIKACRSAWTAVALAVLGFVIDLASVPFDGLGMLFVSGLTVAATVTTVVLLQRHRDRKILQELS